METGSHGAPTTIVLQASARSPHAVRQVLKAWEFKQASAFPVAIGPITQKRSETSSMLDCPWED